MTEKKNPKMDMDRKRVLIFNLGLLVTGSFTLAAFTYSSPEDRYEKSEILVVEDDKTFEVSEKEEVKPPVEKAEQLPEPEPPQQPQNLGSPSGLAITIKPVGSGGALPGTFEGTGQFGSGTFTGGTKKPIDTEEIVIPKIDARYVGGQVAMIEKIMDVQEYPEIDRELGNQGTVYVSFVVEKDGSVTNVKTVRGISKTLDREAERIIRSFPNWIPGEDEYGVVRTRVNIPIRFVLRD